MNFKELQKAMIECGQISELDTQLMDIVGLIREARLAKGLTQTDMSDRTGMSQNQYSKFENFYNSPSLETIIRVMNALNINTREIFLAGIKKEVNLQGFAKS